MNIFSILDDSDNDEPVVKTTKPVKEVKPVAAPKKDIPGAPPKASAKKDAAKTGDIKPKPAPKEKSAAPAAAADPSEAPKENRAKTHKSRHGETRGGRGSAGEGKDGGKREFDRRSGTGRGREVSRDGRGPFGAGNHKQDALEAEKDPSKAEVKIDEVGTTDVEEAVAEPEPEDKTITLDDFMQKRKIEREEAQAVFAGDVKARAADKEVLAGLSKAGKEEYGSELAAKDYSKKDQRSTGKSKILDVGFKNYQQPAQESSYEDRRPPRVEGRGSGGRGGRGGDRNSRGGGRGGGAPSSGRGSGGPATVFNAQDFPTL